MKGVIAISGGVAVARLIAQSGDTIGIPSISTVGSLTATGAVIYLVIWLTTKTLPAMQQENTAVVERIVKDFRDEMIQVRADRERDREHFACQAQLKVPK